MEDNNPRKALYKSLITSSNPDIRDGIRRFSFNKFDNLLTTNHNFQKDLFLDMKDAGLATGDESHFIATYIAEPKKMGNVVVEEAPQRPVQVPPLLQPAQQGPSLTAVTGQQAVTPMDKPYEPFQFQNQAEIDQAAKSPVFLANPQAVEAQKGNIIMPTKEAERDFNQLPADQQRAAIEGGTGFESSQKKANEKRSGLQKLKDFGKTLGGMANNAYDAVLASEKLLGAKQRDLLTFGGAEENLKKVKKEVLSSMDNIQNQYAQDLRNNNIETSLIDAVNNGELNRLPEAVGYNVANAVVSGLGAAFTGGYSMFAQTLADDYKSGVENLAKETGRTPEQVIADGDDAELIPAVSATIQGLIEKAQIGLASKAIDSKGAYKFIRDLVIDKAGKKSWSRAAGAGLGVAGASFESGLQGVTQELTSMASEQAAGSDSFDKFYDKLSTAIASEEGSKRLNESLVGEAIGAGGLIGGGRALNAGLDMISRGPSSGPPTQLGGIATIPANPNDPNFQPDGQPTNTPEQPVVADTGTKNLAPTNQGVSGGTVKPQQSQEQIKKRIEDIEGILSNSSAQLQLTGNDPLLKEGRTQLLQELAQLKPLLNAEQLESQVKTEEPKVKTPEQKTSEWDDVMERNDPKEVNDWLLNNSEKGDVFQHEDGTYFVVSDVRTRRSGKKVIEIEIRDPEIEGILDVHIIEESDAGSKESTKFSQSKTPSFKYGYTDNSGNRGVATARYVGNQQQSNESETTFVTVTPEELDAFKQGQVDQERANAIADDVAAIQKGELTLEAIEDPNYREMVRLKLAENQAAPAAQQTNEEALPAAEGATTQQGADPAVAEMPKPVKGRKQIEKTLSDLTETQDPLSRLNLIHNFNRTVGLAPDAATEKEISEIQKEKERLEAEGYEVVDLTGKKFNPGYRVFVEQSIPDENLEEGQEIISRVIAPHINKDGKMIQPARIVVTVGTKPKQQSNETTTTTTPSPSVLGETTEATGQTGGGLGTDVPAVDETITDETPLNPAPIPVAADATGGTTADDGTELVAPESGGSEVEGVDVPAANPVMVEMAREFLNIDRLVAKGFVNYVDSKTGKPCAKFGMRDNAFSRGQKWEIVKDLKGYATHEKGGVDLTIDRKGVRMGGPDSKLYAADGLLMPGEPIPPQKKQQLAQEERTKYLQYMDDPTYKKRLGAELFGDKFDNQPDQQKLVESEFAKRRNDIEKIPVSEGDIGNDYGLYTDPYYAGKRKNPQGTIQITNKNAPHQDHPSQNEGTYRQVVAHELGHASHRGDVAGEYQRDSKFETLVDQYHNPDLEKLADLFNPNLGWAPKKEKQEIIDAASRTIGAEKVQQILKKKDELEAEVAQKQKQYGDKYDPNIHGPFYPKEFLEVIDVPRYNHLQRNPTEIATRMIGIRRLAAEKFGYDFNTPFDIKKYKEQIRQYFKENKMIDEMSDLDGVLKLSDDQINEMMKYIAKNNRSNGEVYG